MTIEVRQLVVRVVVEEAALPHAVEGAGEGVQRARDPQLPPGRDRRSMPAAERRALVATCVREVLRALERSQRR